ncbi:mechanosensitive ion channel family protein [Subsaxibacter sp. CAU 1640]|uniref:mechanosensitive ion channel family protein n=1 Tax=Subsaxibacter sp. CAU 1640 TaxID=2933271 RepID=UPI0020045972|nr:mechanosensitive ion channel family protein [Subsaxibacter sp. CAU 1640]MCK7590996.1 mechanosensitive ion channel family protein [Subsaxibacter sp. CAU 1640]
MKEELGKAYDGLINKLIGWMNAIVEGLPNMALAILVILIAYILAKYVFKLVNKITARRVKQQSIVNIISKLAYIAVITLGIFLALGILDLSKTLTSLITGAGVLGLVIGLALQGTLSNTISGIMISFRKKIQIGNWVETNDFAGEIIDINLKNLTLKETDNNIVFIPNKTILETPMKNFSLTPYIRVTVGCGVGYKSDLEFVEKLVKTTLSNTFRKIDDNKPVEFYFTEFGDSSINFICRFWIEGTRNVHKLDASNKAIIAIKKAFDAEGINIPFPIRTLEFNNDLKIQSFSDKQE